MKKNKIVNKIGILVLAVMLSILSSIKEKSVKGGRKTAEFPLDTLFLLDIMSEGKMAVSPFRYFPLCFIVRSGGRK